MLRGVDIAKNWLPNTLSLPLTWKVWLMLLLLIVMMLITDPSAVDTEFKVHQRKDIDENNRASFA